MDRPHRVLLSFLILLTAVATVSQADIPQVISYQGKVTDTSGNPVADGSYTMRFRIYDAVTTGTLLWDSGNRSISVAGGIFSVLLGESPQPALTLAFDADYWLLATFAGVDQTPRQRLASAGYAYMASGLVAGTEVSGAFVGATLTCRNTAASGNADGLYGVTESAAGKGVYGRANATSGQADGVYGLTGSLGGSGVHGESASAGGKGVYGEASAASGTTYGIYGVSASTGGRGVYGLATATSGATCGGRFATNSTAGIGVYGYATTFSGDTYGVYGESNSTGGRGVYGEASSTSGNDAYGVNGVSASTGGIGVYGHATATSGFANGVEGWSECPAGYGVYYRGGIGGVGLMRTMVATSKGPTNLDAVMAAGCWFEDFGQGALVHGQCRIELDPVFREAVTIDATDPMMVYVTPNGRLGEWWVEKGASGFTVIAPEGADGITFDYRVVAKRKGFEAKRLDVCEAARKDSCLYPELREKSEREAIGSLSDSER